MANHDHDPTRPIHKRIPDSGKAPCIPGATPGTKAVPITVTPEPVPVEESIPYMPTHRKDAKKDWVGISGWIAFLVVAVIFVTFCIVKAVDTL